MFGSLFKKKMVDRPSLSDEFLENKKNALLHISDCFKRHKSLYPNDVNRLDMIKWVSTSPNFEDFVFSYGNKVFSVIVVKANITNGKLGMELNERADILVNVCEENNLIPCVFPIMRERGKLKFLGTGYHGVAWNLINLFTGKFFDPIDEATDELIEMSDWEIQDWAIQITLDELKKRGFKVTSYVSMPAINPQIWIEDNNGKLCWVEVVGTKCSKINGFSISDFPQQVLKYDGYLVNVDFAGNELHTDNHVYRGRPADFEFGELNKIYSFK